MVGNGGVLDYNHVCPQVPLYIQGNSFWVDLYILGFSGVDIVLGVQWLSELGPILIDYTTRTMVFSYLGQQVHL